MTTQFVSFQAIFKLIHAEQKLLNRLKERIQNQQNNMPVPPLKQNEPEKITFTNKQIRNPPNDA